MHKAKLKSATAMTALLGLSLYAAPASAQSDGDDEADVIVVEGIRASLNEAKELKRNASGVVDAISAIDIGKFPDTNLAESLQRITGVSISRENNEGAQVTVRGFGPRFNLVTLNGRSLPTSAVLGGTGSFNRSFNFDELAASSVAAVEVYKTVRADLPTGGIGSTINIRTRKPFDREGLVAAGTFKVNHDTGNVVGKDFTPQVSGIVSNTFMDGRLGLLAAGSFSRRDNREERVFTNNFQEVVPANAPALAAQFDNSLNQNPDGTFFLPRSLQLRVTDFERERINGQFVIQARPTDNLEIDLDYHLSRFDQITASNQRSYWFCFCAPRRSGVIDENGVPQFITGVGDDVDYWGFARDIAVRNDSFGVNVDWKPTDRLTFNIDAHHSTSESQPDGQVAETFVNFRSQPGVSGTITYTDNDIPDLTLDFGPVDPRNQDMLIPDVGSQRGVFTENVIKEVKLTGEYEFADMGPLKRAQLGGSFQEFTYDGRFVDAFVVFSSGTIDQNDLDIEFFDRGDIASNFSGGDGLFPTFIRYDPRQAIQLAFDAGEFVEVVPSQNIVEEDTFAAFFSTDFESDLGGMPFKARAGLRFEHTDITSASQAREIDNIRFFSSAEIRPVRGDDDILEMAEGSYEYFLPTIDTSLDVTDTFKVRASYGHSITRTPIAQLSPNTNIGFLRPGEAGDVRASQGNANLLPALSKNIDLSAEWYYAPNSYFSVGLFRKSVTAFVFNEEIMTTLPDSNGNPLRNPSVNIDPNCTTDPTNPAAIDPTDPDCLATLNNPELIFTVSRPTNSDTKGVVQGVEVNLQHSFDFGLGVILNYTFTDGDIEFDTSNFEQQDPAPLTGLSDSANAIIFYEKGPIQARIAYNWRDEFFDGTRLLGAEPVFVDPFQQIDFSASYDINDHISIFVEGINITNEINREHGRTQRQFVSATSYGPRFGFGVRGKL